jgi:hypothetical protein
MTNFGDAFFVSRASEGWSRNKAGAYVKADPNQPCLTDRGVAIFQSVVNDLGNPRFVGAVAGSPGTLPSGMGALESGLGLTRTLSFSNDADGVPMIGFRYAGTTPGSGQLFGALNFGQPNGFPATSADTVTFQVDIWLTVNAGNVPDSVRPTLQGYAANASTLTDFVFPIITNKKGVFSKAVYKSTSSSTAFALPQIRYFLTGGKAYDFTIWMKAPALSKNVLTYDAPVLPLAGALGPTTRGADNITTLMGSGSGPFPGWSELDMETGFSFAGSVAYDAINQPLERTILELSDGTADNSVRLWLSATQRLNLAIRRDGAQTHLVACATPIASVGRQVFAGNVSPAGLILAQNIGLVESVRSGSLTMPTLDSATRVGSGIGGKYLNAYLEQLYFGDNTPDVGPLVNFVTRN